MLMYGIKLEDFSFIRDPKELEDVYRVYLPGRISVDLSYVEISPTEIYYGYPQNFPWEMSEDEKDLKPENIEDAIVEVLGSCVSQTPDEIRKKIRMFEIG